jgi:ribose-phosphate pyrophosphokinase
LYNLKNKSVLIVDDICDGGRTFIEAAKLLYIEGVNNVYLYVTHGLFTKGIQILYDAGIKRIFTYKGEIT